MDETTSLILLHVARQTGRLGRAGFSREVAAQGWTKSIAAARRELEVLVEKRLLTETPGTAYLCVTVEGVEELRKAGRL